MNKVVQISSFIKGLARKEIHAATGPLSTAAGAPSVCQFRVTDQLRVDETTGDYLIQPPAQSKVYKSRSHSALPSWVLNISKVRDSSAFQGKLHQCWPLRGIFFFLCVKKRLVFWFVPVASCPGTGQPWEESGSVLFITSLLVSSAIYRHWLVKIPWFFFSLERRESCLSGS